MSVMYCGRVLLHLEGDARPVKNSISTFQLCARDTKYMPWLACNTSPVNSDIERSRLFGRRLRCCRCVDTMQKNNESGEDEGTKKKDGWVRKTKRGNNAFCSMGYALRETMNEMRPRVTASCTLLDSYGTHTQLKRDELREYARIAHLTKWNNLPADLLIWFALISLLLPLLSLGPGLPSPVCAGFIVFLLAAWVHWFFVFVSSAVVVDVFILHNIPLCAVITIIVERASSYAIVQPTKTILWTVFFFWS